MTAASVSPIDLPPNARAPVDHLVEHGAEAEDVAARIDRAAGRLLRRHVGGGPRDRPRQTQRRIRLARERALVRAILATDALGQPEVEHLDGAVAADHHVGRLEVAMNDALRVRGAERVGHRDGDAQQLAQPQPAAGDGRVEAAPATYSITMKSQSPADSIS